VLSEAQQQTAAVAAERRRALLQLVAQGLSYVQIGKHLGISPQRISVLLRRVPRAEIQAARAAGAGRVRSSHCDLWVERREGGRATRR
jgi:DNA-binding CsgD family transcriptional regulator